ncbi:MAG: polysaccharide deacetylase family protein [Bacteroidetes bacterium]|nr:polysaccharide deacetylase family protein [Bacteroidota bacterium]
MDPDRDAFPFERQAVQATTMLFKTTFITVAFSACNYYETSTASAVGHIQFSLPDDTVKKTIVVLPKKKKKTIYLTFDDGPNKGTKKMMHIVEEEQVPVTFFIIGQHVYGSEEQTNVFDSLVACKYVEIANHSYTHAFQNHYARFYTVPDSVVKDFTRCADSLKLTANIVRTPGRNIWRTATISSTDLPASAAAADTIYKRGFAEVGWDAEWQFDEHLQLKCSSDAMVAEIDSLFAKGKTKTPDNLVLLAHDQVYADNIDSASLHDLIKKLKATDLYDFQMISKYPGVKEH